MSIAAAEPEDLAVEKFVAAAEHIAAAALHLPADCTMQIAAVVEGRELTAVDRLAETDLVEA